MTPRIHNPKLCSRCGRRGKVTDSRPVPSQGAHRRHHVCKCGHDWNTYEVAVDWPELRAALAQVRGTVGREVVTISTASRQVVRK